MHLLKTFYLILIHSFIHVQCVGVISWELYALETLVIKQLEHASASNLLSAHSATSVW